jgi:RHS repeat-associated protein
MFTASGGLYSLYTRDGKLRGGPDGTQGARLWQVYLGDTLVGTRREALGSGTVSRTYHHTDHLGSPVRETNQSAGLVNQTLYAPYGEALNRTVDGPGYTAHRMDAHSGLVYMQQRYYDPVLGRFLSVDPVGVSGANGGNFNRYWYANNNPYKFLDPDGRQSTCTGSRIATNCSAFGMSRQQLGNVIGSKEYKNQMARRIFLPFAGPAGAATEAVLSWKDGDLVGTGLAAIGILPAGRVGGAGGILARSEAAGGHLIARHIGQTSEQLAARLAGNARLPAASTFNSLAQAESAVGSALQANTSQISNWVGAGARGRLVVEAPFSGGSVLVQGATAPVTGTGVRVVLQGNGSGAYHILTGFPVL